MDKDMIDRVAEAIHKNNGNNGAKWREVAVKTQFIEQALAAIEASQLPEQLEAANGQIKLLENANKSLTKGADYWEAIAHEQADKLKYYDRRVAEIREQVAQIDDINKANNKQ